MTERPIIFQGWGVRAIQQNLKTQTRRTKGLERINQNPNDWRLLHFENGIALFVHRADSLITIPLRCPYGVPGDRLWVRETFSIQTEADGDEPPFSDGRPIKKSEKPDESPQWWQPHYQATDPPPDLCCEKKHCRCCANGEPGPHWKPAIHMPRWASRLLLELTDVRVQRVQAITEEDARAEGMGQTDVQDFTYQGHQPTAEAWIAAYSLKWDAINAKDKYVKGAGFGGGTARFESTVKWSDNPWLFPITFRRIEA